MSLRYAVLGFLSIRPMSGYDLKRTFDSSIRHFWSADQAGIYRALGDLQNDGMVEFEVVEQDSRPDRKVYRATASGIDALDVWLAQPAMSPPRREPLLVKLFFAGRVEPEALRQLLSAELTSVNAELSTLRQVSAVMSLRTGSGDETLNAALLGPLLTLTNALTLGTAYCGWLEGLLEMQSRGALTAGSLVDQLRDWPQR